MPYIIKKVKNGFKVCKEDDKTECFSKKPITETKAKKQKTAIILSELRRKGKLEGSGKKYEILELFKGTGSVGKVAHKMGWDVVSVDLDPYYTPEIETDILKWDYKAYQKENNYIPDFIWASPPCNTFSPLSYPLKERDTKTAEPISERAKLGTKILYKTLEIINYFKELNPKLLFIIENPRGMMRNDKKIKKLIRNTTLYCLYGDKRMKPTDFFSNFEMLLRDESKCPNKTVVVVDLPLNDRYKIPSKLIKDMLTQMKEKYESIEGSGKRDELIEKAEEKVGKIPERYVPKSLSLSDLRKQLKSIIEGVKRPQLKSFKSKKSEWTIKAEEYFGNDRSLNDIVEKIGETPKRKKEILKGLKEINKKGEAAYYTSGSRPNQTPQSWGIARVYSVLFGGASRKIDKDIVEKYNIPLLGREKIEVMPQETDFEKELKEIGLNPDLYLKAVKIKAKNYGLFPDLLTFSKNPDKKLSYDGVDFGATGYKDFLIYNFLESKGEVPEGTAIEKRNSYRSRAEGIHGNWKQEKTSPNNLAINILW